VTRKMTRRALTRSEAKRDVWQEVLDSVREVKAGRGRRRPVGPSSPAPEPKVLRVIGEESQRNGTNMLNSRQIDQIIKAARAKKNHRADDSASAVPIPLRAAPGESHAIVRAPSDARLDQPWLRQ